MTTQPPALLARLLTGNGVLIALAVLLGATSAMESWAPIVGLGAVMLLYISVQRPSIPVALAFFGIMMDARGMMGATVLGIPLSMSKIMVIYALFSHVVHALVKRKPLIYWMPTTPAMFLIVLTMVMSLITSVFPRYGYVDTAGVLMLAVMCHLIYTAIPKEDVPRILRFMSTVMVGILVWSLLTQRREGFYASLDHAWMQRTSAAYGDPNAWSTSLLVTCPMLIAFLVKDKHWSATPLLVLLGAAFPAAIVQSMSRAGLISFVIISGGLLYMVRERKWLIVGTVGLVLVALPFLINLDAALLRYQTLLDPTLEADLGHGSLRERTALLEAGVKLFLENPVLGVGAGAFRYHASYVSAGEVWKIAHNSYLNVAAEQGVPGILTHLYLMYLIFTSTWNVWNRGATDTVRTFGLGFMLSLTAYSAMAMTLNLATFAAAWYMLGIGLLVGRYGGAEVAQDARPSNLPRPALLAEAPTT